MNIFRPSCNILKTLLWTFSVFLMSSTASIATVYTVGPDGTLEQILDEVTVILADGDAIHVPGGSGALAQMTHSTSIVHDLTLFGDGKGVSIVSPASHPVLFTTVRASLTVRDLTFDGFTDAFNLFPLVTQTAAVFDAQNIEIINGDRGIVSTEHGGFGGNLARVHIKDSHFFNLENAAIQVATRSLDAAQVTGNHIKTVGLVGILLGNQGNINSNKKSQNIVVIGNHIEDVAARALGTYPTRNFGIAAFGREVVIQGNVIRDLQRDIDPTLVGDVYVGIYTKASYTVIQGNVIRDPGPGYAIDLKGFSRNGTANILGYGSIVANNQIIVTDPGDLRYSGIKTNVEDVTIQGNHIEGASQEVILVQSLATDDVSVIGNTMILGAPEAGFGHGVQVQTDERPLGALNAGQRRLLITNNRFVGFEEVDYIVNRVYPQGGTQWQEDALPVGIDEWVVANNIRH